MQTPGLIVGLGNPGAQYLHTRHNIGFMVLDALRECLEKNSGLLSSPPQDISGKRHSSVLWRACFDEAWYFAKPLTFMNASGHAVSSLLRYYRLSPEKTLIIHDELDLPFGRIQFKHGGGTAGHNGLKSIKEQTGNADFDRLRIGIGRPAGAEAATWVLSDFSASERAVLHKIIETAIEGVCVYIKDGIQQAMQRYNAPSALISPRGVKN